MSNNIIETIKQAIEEQGVSNYRLAQISGLNRQTIDNALEGVVNPTLNTIESLCEALGLKLKVVKENE